MPATSPIVCLMLLVTTFCGLGYAEESSQPVKIKAEAARKYEGKQVEVVIRVRASKYAEHHEIVYLDSERDYHDEKNLGILISSKGLEDLKKRREIEQPADHFLNKSIRVTGLVFLNEDRPYIKVDQAEQIEFPSEDKSSADPEKTTAP